MPTGNALELLAGEMVKLTAHELYSGAAHFYEQIAQDFEGDKTQVAALEAFMSKGG